MDKKIAGLLGAAAALTAITAANAAVPADANGPAATTYQELLSPVPNAVAALQADNVRLTQTTAEVAGTQLAQLLVRHHHHHHHHRFFRRHHHHHHHHQYR